MALSFLRDTSQWREWHPRLPWIKISFIDGTSERGLVPIFRRLNSNREWEYRRGTQAEIAEHHRETTW
jgi:hypothetical protein